MLKKLLLGPAILCLLSLSYPALAQTYDIGAYPIPLMIENKDKGVFIDLVKEISKRLDKEFNIIVRPTKRILKNFQDENLVGFFPGLDVIINNEFARSDSIYVKQDFAFVKKADDFISEVSQLQNKRVGLTLGHEVEVKSRET